MCIAIATTEHPDYPFILLSNRDEYFKRPTMPVHFRTIEGDVKLLSPLDLARPEHGTWIGVTTSGKVAVLVNYHELDNNSIIGEVSRGVLPLAYLCSNELDDEWREGIKRELSKIGGFSLLYGKLSLNSETGKIDTLNILSNRGKHGKIFETCDYDELIHDEIQHKSTFGLSNSLYNQPWKKVAIGEDLLKDLMKEAANNCYSQEEVVEKCFELLSHDTYNREVAQTKDFDAKLMELRNSVFIPPLQRSGSNPNCVAVGKYYGTRTQTIILLDKEGNLNYYEKNIYTSDNLEKDDEVAHYKFNIFQSK